MRHSLTIGQIGCQAGMKPSAVRYYERRGVIPPAQRLANGYRVYDLQAVRRLCFVRRAQALGMRLKDAQELLQLAEAGRSPCRRVRQLARQRVGEIDQRIRELRTLRGQLEQLLRRKPARRRPRDICPLIEADLFRADAGGILKRFQ